MENIKTHRELHPSLTTAPGSRSALYAAGIYLAACGTLAVYSTLTFTGPDANLAGVIPYLTTAPWSLLPLGLLDPGSLSHAVFIALPVIGALINAALIHTAVRRLGSLVHRRRLSHARTTHPIGAWS